MADCIGLENRQRRKTFAGSNPAPSALETMNDQGGRRTRFILPSLPIHLSDGLGLALEKRADRKTQAREKRAPVQIIDGR